MVSESGGRWRVAAGGVDWEATRWAAERDAGELMDASFTLDFVVGPGRTNAGEPTPVDSSVSLSFPFAVGVVVFDEDPILKKSLKAPLELVPPPPPDPSTDALTCRPRNVVVVLGRLDDDEG